MTDLRLVPSADVGADVRQALARLWHDAFGGRFTADDADHAFGGMHCVAFEDGELVSHASAVPRTLLVGEAPIATGYVEGVATAPDHQRRGHGRRVMAALQEHLVLTYEMGALSTSRQRFYAALGWQRWQGPSFVLRHGRRVRTADEDDGLMVLLHGATAGLEPSQPITCEDRVGDVW